MAKAPMKRTSAYLVTSSDIDTMPVDSVLIDHGNQLERNWTLFNLNTAQTTEARGIRLVLLCPDCRIRRKSVGLLGHDGVCGSQPVIEQARQEIAHAKKKALAEREVETTAAGGD